MAATVSASSGSMPVAHPAVPESDNATMNLDAIRSAKGDINAMRMLLKGNLEACLRLFRAAVAEADVTTQIQLSYALHGMELGKDATKDFSLLHVTHLETFDYSGRGFGLFSTAYDRAMRVISTWTESEDRAAETFRLAARHGYLPAVLEHLYAEWDNKIDSDYLDHKETYGFAVQLRPFVGQGNKDLDFLFGSALKNGCQRGSKLYYEGFYWMNQSVGNEIVAFPREGESFEAFKWRYSQTNADFYELDGFGHAGSLVLAPSRETWEMFVKKKLGDVSIAPIESYLFAYDPKTLQLLLGDKIIVSTPDLDTITLSSRAENKPIAEISVGGSIKIHQPCEHLQLAIKFIQNVFARTGTPLSARCWLKQMGCYISVYP